MGPGQELGAAVPNSIGDLLQQTVERFPERPALVYGGGRRTYSELLERVDRLAGALLALGLKPGDRLGLYLYNSDHAYEALLAGSRAGLLFVPLNFMLHGEELATIVNHSGTRAIIVESELFGSLAPLLQETLVVEFLINIDQPGDAANRVDPGDSGTPTTFSYEELIANGPTTSPASVVSPDDLFALMYTSGTTGLPKGVMLTHRNVVTHALHMVRDYRIGTSSRVLIVLPYFVGASLNGLGLPCLYRGGTVVVMRRFSTSGFLHAVESAAITHVQVVPTLLVRLLEADDIDQFDLSSLEVFGYGSAPMPVDRLRQAVDRFGPIFTQMYGLTETCAMATNLRREEHELAGPKSARLASCGRPVDGVEIRLVDEAGRTVVTGDVGEVEIKGPTVMRGYWEMPDLTADAVRDGWFRSGDLAYADDDGFIYLTDRKKDMIITGGFNVYPKEVEEVLYTHPAVFECAVIGVPDPEWGEAVTAVVALRTGAIASEGELLAFCRDRLTRFKRPKSIEFTAEIPRNPSGKVLKRVLRQEFEC